MCLEEPPSYRGYRFPAEVISRAVWLYYQRFASVHGVVQNLFRVGRHLLRAAHYRLLRGRSFCLWDEMTSAC